MLSSSMSNENVLIIGFGVMGKIHAKKISLMAKFKHIAVVDVNEQRIKDAISVGYSAYGDLHLAYQTHKNFKVVVITTNTAIHYTNIKQIILKTAESNLPLPAIFVEKPIVATKQEAQEIQDLLLNQGYNSKQLFMCGYLLRESPAVTRLIEKIENEGESINSITIKWQKQRSATRASAGVIQDEATHSLDLVQYILKRLNINHEANSLNVLSVIRSRDVVNVVEQDLIYSEGDPGRNPFAEIEYTIKFGAVKINALSSFIRSPQERSIIFKCTNKSYTLIFDDNGRDWCDEDMFATDKIECLWQSFVSALDVERKLIHLGSILDSINDVLLTNELEKQANIFLKPTFAPSVNLLFSSTDTSKLNSELPSTKPRCNFT